MNISYLKWFGCGYCSTVLKMFSKQEIHLMEKIFDH